MLTYHKQKDEHLATATSLIRIATNAKIAKLVDDDKVALDIIGDALSYLVEGHEFMTNFQTGRWNGRSSFLTRATRTFPAGFAHLVQQELIRRGYRVAIVKRPLPEPLGPVDPVVDEWGNDNPRYDYQLKVVQQLLKHGRGIAQIATGGGKSKIALLVTARIKRMTLFLTTRGVLMHQMARAYKKAGINCGFLGDGQWTPKRGVNVGMVQTLVERLKVPDVADEVFALTEIWTKRGISFTRDQIRKEAERRVAFKQKRCDNTLKILGMVELVIGEEAHEAGGESYFQILQHCKQANYRLALTATPFMRESAEDNMKLMAAFGPVLVKVSEKTLIDRGILATPKFLYIDAPPHPKLRKTSPWQRARSLEIVEGPGRNQTVIDYARKAIAHKLPTIVLVQMKAHGQVLLKRFKEAGIKARYIQGESSQGERQRALDELSDGRCQVLIGTTIIDVGVDVPAVGMVILAGGGKAEIALRQRIGRGLRAKNSGPNVCFVVDFTDKLNHTLRDHAKQRRSIVEATPGFAENILPAGSDFDWVLFH
jgi:superfamily II DNA or RNA helicase